MNQLAADRIELAGVIGVDRDDGPGEIEQGKRRGEEERPVESVNGAGDGSRPRVGLPA